MIKRLRYWRKRDRNLYESIRRAMKNKHISTYHDHGIVCYDTEQWEKWIATRPLGRPVGTTKPKKPGRKPKPKKLGRPFKKRKYTRRVTNNE